MPVVVVTNIVVSALLMPRSAPRQALDAILDGGKLLISEATVIELEDAKVRSLLAMGVATRILGCVVSRYGTDSDPASGSQRAAILRTINFLELAISGSATHIITGDDDLLVLHPFRNIAIVSPQTFLTQLS